MISVKHIGDIVDKKKLPSKKDVIRKLITPICLAAYKKVIFTEKEKVPENSDVMTIGSKEELLNFDYMSLVDKIIETETWKTKAMYIASNVSEQDVRNSLAGLLEAHIIPRYLDKVEGKNIETIQSYNDLVIICNIRQKYSGYGIYKSFNVKTSTSIYLKPNEETVGYITPIKFPVIEPSQPLSDFGTKNKTELSDLSPLYIDFLLQKDQNQQTAKHIFVTDPPTGSGKSFSIATLITTIAASKDRDMYDKYIYMTDTRENVSATFNDTRTKMMDNPIAASELDKMILLKSKKDNILDKKRLLEIMPADIKKMKSYKGLTRAIKAMEIIPKDCENIFDTGDELNKRINAFQEEIKFYIEEEYKKVMFEQNGKYSSLYYFVIEEYAQIVELFPEIKLKHCKYIFATTDKTTYPIDTIFEGKYFLLADVKNSVFFIDESDAQKNVLNKRILQDSQKSVADLIDIAKIAIPNLYNHTLTIQDQGIQDLLPSIKSLYERTCELREKYQLDHTINLDSQSASFMKIRKNNVLTSVKSLPSYFEINENNEINITPDAIDKTLDTQTFVQESDSIKNDFFDIIKKIANIKAKNETDDTTSTHYQYIYSLLVKYFGTKYDSEALNLITVAIDRYKSKDEEVSDDYYMYPGSYAKFSQDSNSLLAPAIKSFTIHTTPERMLAELAARNYIIMLSATAQNESPARNFDFSWHLLNSQLYTLNERQRNLEREYIQKRDEYSCRVSYDINTIPYNTEEKITNLISSMITESEESKNIIEEVRELMLEIKQGCRDKAKTEKQAKYDYDIAIGIVWSMLKFAANKNRFCLGLEMKSIDISLLVYQKIDKLINLINANSQQQIKWYSAKAENLSEQIKNCQSDVGPNTTVILWTTYQTAAKGLNVKVKWEKEWGYDDIVAVNEAGNSNFIFNEMFVDMDGLYCGKLTHVISPLESNDDFDAQSIKVMSAISMLDSLKQTNEISEDEYNERIQLAMNGRDNDIQLSLANLNRTKMYICKIGADLGQSFGRITRCNNRFKDATVIVSNMLVEQIKDIPQDVIFGKIENNFRYTTKQIVEFIFDNSKQKKKRLRAPAGITTKRSAELIHNDLCHVYSETETYKKHREAIKKLCISDVERKQYLHSSDSDEQYIGAQYLSLSAQSFSDGYSYGVEDMKKIDDVDYVEQVYELAEKPIRVSRAELNLNRQNQEILDMLNKKGYNFDTDVTGDRQCILTPAAFSILKGNIGEEITRLLFSKIGHQCEELPSEIYEKADFVITDYVENGCVIAIDSKYYNLDRLDNYDEKEKKIPYFKKKFLDIKDYYHAKKLIGMVINTQPTDEDDLESYNTFVCNDDVTIVTIPNIYDQNGEFNRDILKTLIHLIDD